MNTHFAPFESWLVYSHNENENENGPRARD